MSDLADISLRQAALIAGLGYVVSFVFGYGNVRREKLNVRGDPAATASNIVASESRFRVGVASWIVVLVADVVVAWALYIFLKPVSDELSLLTAWFRLINVAVAAIAVVNLLSVLDVLCGDADTEGLRADARTAQSRRLLRSYDFGFNVAFVFFGLHILGLGHLIVRSDYAPRCWASSCSSPPPVTSSTASLAFFPRAMGTTKLTNWCLRYPRSSRSCHLPCGS